MITVAAAQINMSRQVLRTQMHRNATQQTRLATHACSTYAPQVRPSSGVAVQMFRVLRVGAPKQSHGTRYAPRCRAHTVRCRSAPPHERKFFFFPPRQNRRCTVASARYATTGVVRQHVLPVSNGSRTDHVIPTAYLSALPAPAMPHAIARKRH